MVEYISLCFTLGIAIANQCSGDLKQIFHPPPHKLQVAFASLKQALLADHNCKHKLRCLDCSYWVFSFHLLVQKGVSGTYVISDSPRCFLPPNTQCAISGIPSSPGVSETLPPLASHGPCSQNGCSSLSTMIYCCCSVAQWCLTLCDSMDCSTPGFPILYHLLECAQTHVH